MDLPIKNGEVVADTQRYRATLYLEMGAGDVC